MLRVAAVRFAYDARALLVCFAMVAAVGLGFVVTLSALGVSSSAWLSLLAVLF